MLLGCIADDFTGATDLANTLTRHGMRTVQTIGVPAGAAPAADAIVVALKSRTIAAGEAVRLSLDACRWLKRHGARQIYFKYCSTFDSTDAGNIGPVADALLDELGADFTVACPAFPENGRTIYLGHLFVGRDLLSDSGMRNHPLTPMRDANLVRVLGRQTGHGVGLIPYAAVTRGAAAIAAGFADLRAGGVRHAIVDAVADSDLLALGEACRDLALVTGGSGAAIGLPENFRRAGLLPETPVDAALDAVGGSCVVLSGSCSTATLQQVEAAKALWPSLPIDVPRLASDGDAYVADVVSWAGGRMATGPLLIYSSAAPDAVAAIQARLGRNAAGAMVEACLAAVAKELVAKGVRRLVVAGGETSGAVVTALGIAALEIGPQIEAGVPATLSLGSPRLALALKSGNFGSRDFFRKAVEALA